MLQSQTTAALQNTKIHLETRMFGNNFIQITYQDLLSCYLVTGQNGFILIDTLVPVWTEALIQEIKKHQFPVTHILLTHAHHDHAGGLEGVHKSWPEAEIALTAREARLLTGDLSLDSGEPQNPPRGNYFHSEIRPTRHLEEGDQIESLQVVISPGHTPGHAAFLDRRNGTLIAGDAFQTLEGGAVAGTVIPLLPQPALATWSKQLARQSAIRLRALNPERLAVAHGPVIDQPLPLMDRAIKIAEEELEREGVQASVE